MPTKTLAKRKSDEASDGQNAAALLVLHRRKPKKYRMKRKAEDSRRYRMHDGKLVTALERDYRHAKREYHGLGEALREARETHEAQG